MHLHRSSVALPFAGASALLESGSRLVCRGSVPQDSAEPWHRQGDRLAQNSRVGLCHSECKRHRRHLSNWYSLRRLSIGGTFVGTIGLPLRPGLSGPLDRKSSRISTRPASHHPRGSTTVGGLCSCDNCVSLLGLGNGPSIWCWSEGACNHQWLRPRRAEKRQTLRFWPFCGCLCRRFLSAQTSHLAHHGHPRTPPRNHEEWSMRRMVFPLLRRR